MTISLPSGATLRPLELPARADEGPTPVVREYAEVRNAVTREETGSDDDAMTAEALLPMLYSDANMVRRQWYIERDGAIIGCAPLNIQQDDGASTAIGTIAILKQHWSEGIGTAVLAFAEEQALAAGARRLLCWQQHQSADAQGMLTSPTGFGSVPNDHSARFLQRHGFRLEQVERASEFVCSDESIERLAQLRADAEAHAADYRTVHWMLPTPDEFVDGYAWLKSRMSTDVPDAELGTPVEIWDADRVRELEKRYAARGARVQVTAAQHAVSGELCAFNELTINDDDTAKTDQHDTLVLAEHRGRRLGMLVKAVGLTAWHERFPGSTRVVTYNAEENRPMLDINEVIGFTPFAYEGAWRKDLA